MFNQAKLYQTQRENVFEVARENKVHERDTCDSRLRTRTNKRSNERFLVAQRDRTLAESFECLSRR